MDCVIWAAKRIIKRQRPFYEKQDRLSLLTGFGTDAFSFPSAHTFTAFQFMVLSFFMFNSFGIIFIVYALLVALSRLTMKHHYFSDVVGGAVLGIIFSLINLLLI